MNRRLAYAVLPAAAVVLVDQLSKQIIAATVQPYAERIAVIPGFFDIVHVHNTGAAFSFLAQGSGWQRWFFVAASVLAIIILAGMIARTALGQKLTLLTLGLILGGAAGNLVDRLFIGHVIDFIDVYVGSYHWPAFNVADSAISVGVFGLLLLIITGKERRFAPPETGPNLRKERNQ
ncbi:signal peptidase II [Oceanidesulfovibrio marinus]|uniref:Lipoprotein signal peptidase n=1 Tax=Oceanidesulfovibrio marinus TaxID=370038 RepID=A0A6P1ZK27_9BACT|nr:signal peptidase II [Oceanidesulfovibrio marinus]QJT08257.1 signal peptidase II [Oceanidesulfovibrio marinus]TVM35150.1 signal peptidase II [Oceanidesulfovibrio marinus]